MTIIKSSFHGQLETLGLTDAFADYCRTANPSITDLQHWCRDNGIPENKIPLNFQKIRRTLGVRATHGGNRGPIGPPVLKVCSGRFV